MNYEFAGGKSVESKSDINKKEHVIDTGKSFDFEPCSSESLRDSTSKLLKCGKGTKSCLQDNLLIEKANK
jgi:hypothetical protein